MNLGQKAISFPKELRDEVIELFPSCDYKSIPNTEINKVNLVRLMWIQDKYLQRGLNVPSCLDCIFHTIDNLRKAIELWESKK